MCGRSEGRSGQSAEASSGFSGGSRAQGQKGLGPGPGGSPSGSPSCRLLSAPVLLHSAHQLGPLTWAQLGRRGTRGARLPELPERPGQKWNEGNGTASSAGA